jgi:hypothetical protein
MTEKDLSSEKFPGQFLPAELRQMAEYIIT